MIVAALCTIAETWKEHAACPTTRNSCVYELLLLIFLFIPSIADGKMRLGEVK